MGEAESKRCEKITASYRRPLGDFICATSLTISGMHNKLCFSKPWIALQQTPAEGGACLVNNFQLYENSVSAGQSLLSLL